MNTITYFIIEAVANDNGKTQATTIIRGIH